jgi:hypothetical protein
MLAPLPERPASDPRWPFLFWKIRPLHDLRLTPLLLGISDIRSTARYAQLDTADLAKALV